MEKGIVMVIEQNKIEPFAKLPIGIREQNMIKPYARAAVRVTLKIFAYEIRSLRLVTHNDKSFYERKAQ